MRTYGSTSTLGLWLVAAVLLSAGSAGAGSLQVPTQGTTTGIMDLSSATIWIDDQGIQHVRGGIYYEEFVGEAGGFPVTGSGIGVFNWNLDLQTYNGDGQAKTVYEGTWGNLTGTWEGVADLTVTAGVYEGTWNWAHGGGDFAGMHERGTITGDLASFSAFVEGVIHLPHGEGGLPSGSPLRQGESTWGAIKAHYEDPAQ
jgi:hypothetical protein